MSIFKTYFQAKLFHFKDLLWVLRFHFFKYLIFLPIDLFFLAVSFFINPYRLSRKYLLKKGAKEIYAYGETPLRTFTQIAKEAGLTSQDSFLELGSGRGRGAFWLFSLIGCRVMGIEQIGFFVRVNKLLLRLFKKKRLSFVQGDYLALEKPFKEATVIYLYGTNLEEEFLKKLVQKFKVLNSTTFKTKTRATTKIITISYALSEYDQSFVTQKEWNVVFPWGKTTAYLNSLK